MTRPAPTRFHLVRHGEIAANVEKVWHGSIDSPLTERGRRQAEAVGRHLADALAGGAAVALYSSPLQRARDTALAIAAALAVDVRLDAALAEYDLGEWEGRPYPDLAADGFFERVMQDPDFAPPGAESPRQVAERITGALARLAAEHPGERVVVVSHGAALNLAVSHLVDGSLTAWNRLMRNCAVSEIELAPEPRVITFNLCEHLEGAAAAHMLETDSTT
jgi:broad specificity phosphatase PhoE